MQICGFQKTTLLDYPDHLASIVFFGGCNFRCPYCHNAPLVLDAANQSAIPKEEVLAYLKTRKNILEGICISGGEPTLCADLLDFMKEIKELDYRIKLDTNGTNPSVIKKAYSLQLVDYVAMDIKTSPEDYPTVCGLASIDIAPIRESVQFLKDSGITHEFRTTVVKEFHTDETFLAIADWLEGNSNYYLQSYQDGPSVIKTGLHNYSPDKMNNFRSLVLPKLPNTYLRGLD